ncbi:MAG: PadR family transcriptional regulator [Candidatus Bipolaricaulota bacterium]
MKGFDTSLGYAVLGLLLSGPCHGYALRERFTSALSPVWKLAQSQLYATLHRLENEGLVTSTRRHTEGRPPRVEYAATPEGTKAALDWARAPVRRARHIRVEFPAKLYILRRNAPHEVPHLLAAQEEFLRRLQGRLAGQRALPSDDPVVGTLSLELRRHQVQALRAWLDRCRQALEPEKEGAWDAQ